MCYTVVASYLSEVLVFALALGNEVGELRCKELGGHDDLSRQVG